MKGMSEEYYQRQIKDLNLRIDNLEFQRNMKQEKIEQLQSNWNSLRECIQDMIYTIEPKGTGINYNCEYDSEEDFIDAMKEQSKLNTLKFVLDKMNELEKRNKNE